MNKTKAASIYGKTVMEGFYINRKKYVELKLKNAEELTQQEQAIKNFMPEVLMEAHQEARIYQEEYLRYIVSLCNHLLDSETSDFKVADELQLYIENIESIIINNLRSMRLQVVDEIPVECFIKIIGG